VDTEDPKARQGLGDRVWSILWQRHPSTAWWWSDSDSGRVPNFFPVWSAEAFAKEATDWRRFAQETTTSGDGQVRHWGRFARWTATRLLAGSFRGAAEPLRHANAVLDAVQVLDPDHEVVDVAQLASQMVDWLSAVRDVQAGDEWRQLRLRQEAIRLKSHVGRWLKDDAVSVALDRYVERVTNDVSDDTDPLPWVTVAHVVVEEWRIWRETMTQEPPVVIHRPQYDPGGVRDVAQFSFPTLHRVVRPDLTQWWMRPKSDEATIYVPSHRTEALSLAVLLALWHQQSRQEAVTWALTQPPQVEGGLESLVGLIGQFWPSWAPVVSGFLAQWLQRRRALAVADAWLWLDRGDADEVVKWLGRFMDKSASWALIPWLKSNPGYYVMAHRTAQVLTQTGPTSWEHWMLKNGPVMPGALFLAPDYA